jgi:hypothetical protein
LLAKACEALPPLIAHRDVVVSYRNFTDSPGPTIRDAACPVTILFAAVEFVSWFVIEKEFVESVLIRTLTCPLIEAPFLVSGTMPVRIQPDPAKVT